MRISDILDLGQLNVLTLAPTVILSNWTKRHLLQ